MTQFHRPLQGMQGLANRRKSPLRSMSRLVAPDPTAAALSLVFDTSLDAGEEISVPLYGTVNCHVDWGDGNSDDYTTTGNKAHTYSAAGIYTVTITGTLTTLGSGTFWPGRLMLTQCNSFGELALTSLNRSFTGCSNLTKCPLKFPQTITSINGIFENCTAFNDSNIEFWKTSNVTSMNAAFVGATTFNRDLSGWSVANCASLQNLFNGASAFEGVGLAAWDYSGLAVSTGLNGFAGGSAAIATENYDALLIAWDASKLEYRSDLSPDLGGATYTSGGAAAAARSALISYGWTITDGGAA